MTEPMKRLTFDIPADLHKRIRLDCLERGTDMAVALRQMLQAEFVEPNKSSVATIPHPPVPAPSAQANRVGKRAIIGYFPEDCAWQWKQLSVERRISQQELLAEAINDCFTKYGKSTLA